MGDSACLVHPFSYASGLPTQPNQGNPMHALGESVSFGRFMSESLAWEKWSTFSHNRYVEEAERYAQPGSVAQKKAFFEAHYKRIAAAKKAAALLEQANAAAAAAAPSIITQSEESKTHKINDNCLGAEDSQPLTSISSHVAVNESTPEPEIKTADAKSEFMIALTGNEQTSSVKQDEPAAVEVMEAKAPLETYEQKGSLNPPDNLENSARVSGSELTGMTQMEKPLLMQNFLSDQEVSSVKTKKKSTFSSFKSSVYGKTSKVPCTPAKPITTPRSRKGSNATTPITNKSTLDFTEKKTSTPKSKSLCRFINSTPAKLLTPANRKTENSRIAPDSFKASQNCRTPPRTQDMATSARMSNHHSATTPCSANTWTKTPVDGNKTTGPKWNILSAVCSKSLTACRNKLQSPTLSTPFILRTEERATRRKQKLEEKFNSKEGVKVQQTKFKEKAELELRKLRQSFCFKARPLPDFYKERETQNNQMENACTSHPVAQPQSPKLGRKPSSRKMQGTFSLPSSISLNKNGDSKHVVEKNDQTTDFPASTPEMISHENASPNIQ